MLRNLLWPAVLLAALGGQTAHAETGMSRLDRELTAVIRWEMLWKDTPDGFHIPTTGAARLAAQVTPNAISYCSHDLGVCARYRTDPNRNWERDAVGRVRRAQSDQDALSAFNEESSRPPANAAPRQGIGAHGGFSGSPSAGSGIRWAATVILDSREEIILQYRQTHPAELGSLTRWIRSSMSGSGGGASITIACFAPTDPMVYYYVDRAAKESVVMAAYWDKETETWAVASSLVRSQGPQRFDEMRRTIESVACSTIKPE